MSITMLVAATPIILMAGISMGHGPWPSAHVAITIITSHHNTSTTAAPKYTASGSVDGRWRGKLEQGRAGWGGGHKTSQHGMYHVDLALEVA